MKPKTHKNEPSQRQLRIGELVRHILAQSIMRTDFSHSPILRDIYISVSEARVSPDLSNATIFVNALQGVPNKTQLAELNKYAPTFRKHLANEMTQKSVPQLHFVADEAAVNSQRIDSLLNLPQVKRDLDN